MAKEKKTQKEEMSLEEARQFRASLYKPQPKALSDAQKREAFRIFWAANKAQYGRNKSIENSIWLHLKAIKMDSPEQFAEGLDNFGLKKLSNRR